MKRKHSKKLNELVDAYGSPIKSKNWIDVGAYPNDHLFTVKPLFDYQNRVYLKVVFKPILKSPYHLFYYNQKKRKDINMKKSFIMRENHHRMFPSLF
jgi:hypothetical protein